MIFSLQGFLRHFRRFGTAKRLKQDMNLKERYFSKTIFEDLKLLIPIEYILTFGSAKPTSHIKTEPIRRVDGIHRLRAIWTIVKGYDFVLSVDCIHPCIIQI